MTVQLTIIGTGRIGTSLGLALAEQKDQIFRIGHDRSSEHARQAEKLGAFDKIVSNLYAAVDKSDIIVLALPVDEALATLKLIANDLKEGSVVMHASTNLVAACAQAKELLPAERHFVTLAPSLNPEYISETQKGPEAAHADLFKRSVITIAAPQGSDSGVVKLAADLTAMLGAKPYFADPLEYDGLTAGSNTLPKLAAAALINAVTDQPGWQEGRKLAGGAFAQISELLMHLDEEKALGKSALLNRDNSVRVIDNLIIALRQMREAIANEDEEALKGLFEKAIKDRETWLKDRYTSSWEKGAETPGLPSASESLSRMFLGGLARKREQPKDKK
jgi:prephenate dehydrogenase